MAHGRGYLMYLAMAVRPAGWTSTGIDIFVDGDGVARYPTLGAPPRYMMAGLNWEASTATPTTWQETYYTTVGRWDPTIARDLRTAAMIDIGRDGVAMIASVDTFYLPELAGWLEDAAYPARDRPRGLRQRGQPAHVYLPRHLRPAVQPSRAAIATARSTSLPRISWFEAVTLSYGMGFIW